MRNMCAVILVTATLAVSCGANDDGAGTASPAPDVTAATPDASPRVLPTTPPDHPLIGALIQPADLGQGWESFPVGERTAARTYLCDTEIDNTYLLDGVDAEIIRTSDEGGLVAQFVSRPGEQQAASFLDAFRDASPGCDRFIVTDGVARTEWRIQPASLTAQYGDDAYAVALHDEVSGDLYGQFVVMRFGDLVTGVTILLGAESPEPVLARIAARLEQFTAAE